MATVAVIPARGGSKRIPRKNVRPFLGRPMIAWPIGAARESGLFDRVVVSTDDEEIARVAHAEGAEVPFMRDADLADDHAPVTDAVRDAVRRLALPEADMVCLVYAAAPFLAARDLRAGLELLRDSGADYAVSVGKFPAPVERALVVEDGRLAMLDRENLLARSQDLREAWFDAAQFAWGSAGAWLSGRRVFEAPTVPVPLPRWRVQDIDAPEDWDWAERLARAAPDGGA